MTGRMLEIAPQAFRNTAAHEGWKEHFSPDTGATRYLSYARLVFGKDVTSHTLAAGVREWALFCINGPVAVTAGAESIVLGKHDMLYIPRDTKADISGPEGADLAAGGCPALVKTAVQLVRYDQVKDDPAFFFDVGTQEMGTKRRIFNMLGHNVKASRLLAGFTIGERTAWTSWPPHEHSSSKEEFYLFFDMPPEAFSVQFVYETPEAPEFRECVRRGDCVTVPGGYHPTAAAPGYRSVFLWVMAAFDPEKDRDFKHGIAIQPEYRDIPFV